MSSSSSSQRPMAAGGLQTCYPHSKPRMQRQSLRIRCLQSTPGAGSGMVCDGRDGQDNRSICYQGCVSSQSRDRRVEQETLKELAITCGVLAPVKRRTRRLRNTLQWRKTLQGRKKFGRSIPQDRSQTWLKKVAMEPTE